ncbi:MAG: hypothetical protein ACREOI_05865 [bacterium]
MSKHIVGKSIALLFPVWLCTCSNNDKYFVEIADAPVQDGIRLRMDKPVQVYKDNFFSDENMLIQVTNFSSDTIYFENIFVFIEDHPIWGNFKFCIFDTNGHEYPLVPGARHYYEMLKRKAEFVMLPPGASYQDTILVSLQVDYNLSKGKTYIIFAQYVNQRVFDTGTFPVRLPNRKQLWTGVLKSNTYKFKL